MIIVGCEMDCTNRYDLNSEVLSYLKIPCDFTKIEGLDSSIHSFTSKNEDVFIALTINEFDVDCRPQSEILEAFIKNVKTTNVNSLVVSSGYMRNLDYPYLIWKTNDTYNLRSAWCLEERVSVTYEASYIDADSLLALSQEVLSEWIII